MRADIVAALAEAGAPASGRPVGRRRLRELRMVDALTGLPTRAAWDARLPALITESGGGLWVVAARLDGVAAVGEALGDPGVDLLLRLTARAWRDVLRAEDLLVRMAGDVFAAAVHAAELATALGVVERMRAAAPHGATCTVGVAGWDGTEDAGALTARGREAMDHGVAAGGARVAVALGA